MRKAVFIAAVVLLAGCSRSEHANTTTTDTSAAATSSASTTVGDNTTRMNPTLPTNEELPSKRTAAAAPAQVRVDLAEYEIRMPDTLQAGAQSFLVTNAGTQNHSLAIEGNGVNVALPQRLPRGDSTTLDVDLKPGTYTVYCPVDGHKGRGMTRTLTVR